MHATFWFGNAPPKNINNWFRWLIYTETLKKIFKFQRQDDTLPPHLTSDGSGTQNSGFGSAVEKCV